jgi:hypothetical protein
MEVDGPYIFHLHEETHESSPHNNLYRAIGTVAGNPPQKWLPLTLDLTINSVDTHAIWDPVPLETEADVSATFAAATSVQICAKFRVLFPSLRLYRTACHLTTEQIHAPRRYVTRSNQKVIADIKGRPDVLFHVMPSKHGHDYEHYGRTVFICEEKRCAGVKVEEWKTLLDGKELVKSEGQSRQLNKYLSAMTDGVRCGMLVDLRSAVAVRLPQPNCYQINSDGLVKDDKIFAEVGFWQSKDGGKSLVDFTLGYICMY